MCAKKKSVTSDLQRQYITQARFMMRFWWKYSQKQDYQTMSWLILKSSDKAGGPALRLANAVWDFEYRQMFPETPQLIAREENSFSWLKEAYASTGKERRYRVWQAVEMFVQKREAVYSRELLIPVEKEDIRLSVRQNLVRVFFLLSDIDEEKSRQIIRLLLTIDPARRPHLVQHMRVIAAAAHAKVKKPKKFADKMRAVRAMQHQNLWMKGTVLHEAIGVMMG